MARNKKAFDAAMALNSLESDNPVLVGYVRDYLAELRSENAKHRIRARRLHEMQLSRFVGWSDNG